MLTRTSRFALALLILLLVPSLALADARDDARRAFKKRFLFARSEWVRSTCATGTSCFRNAWLHASTSLL